MKMANNSKSQDNHVQGKDVLAILTEDIDKHRTFIQLLYRRTIILGGTLIVGSILLITWFLGDRYDDSLLQGVVNKKISQEISRLITLKIKVVSDEINSSTADILAGTNEAIAESVANAKEKAIGELNQFSEKELFDQVRQNIQPEIEKLQGASFQELASAIELPAGLVAAFDIPAGCPLGWTDLGFEFDGRAIVAATTRTDDPYSYRSTGGSEKHTLTLSEMPAHSHGYTLETKFNKAKRPKVSGQSGATFVGIVPSVTTKTGGGQPHNNMPPYVSLFLCRKE